jgi:5'-nucleotidase (lipoprotein e(P4) family)
MKPTRAIILPLLLLVVACHGPAPATAPGVSPQVEPAPLAHEGLNSVLWMQSATEFRGASIGTFAAARRMLDVGLTDPTWTAAVEQKGSFGHLPPAVIVDVDETVLDNSAYQGRLIRDRLSYATEHWNSWVREEKAPAIPGAVEFVRYAVGRGVTVFYITNRRAAVEEPTRRNLAAAGFPLPAADVILSRDEKAEWATGDKTTRRAEVASGYRVVLNIGDNLGDFISDENTPLDRRLSLTETYRDYWGTRWFVIPNPMYGNWEYAVLGHERLDEAGQLRRKRQALRTAD